MLTYRSVSNSEAENTSEDLFCGGGMKCGSVCGAITGGLMSLGVLGIDDPKTTINFITTYRVN